MAENCQDTLEVAEKATDAIAMQAGMLIENLAESCSYICWKFARPLLATMSSHHSDLTQISKQTFFLLTCLPSFCGRNVAMTMWAFAKFGPQSRCTTVFVFLFPAILVRWISLKIILFLNMEDWNAKHDHIWGPSRTPSHGHALQIWLYAALLAVQGCCRLQNLCFPCHFACNHRRSESRQIQAKNSEELFQDCMVGIAATNPVEISANTYISWWPHPISRKSSRFHQHACNGLEGVGLDGTILTDFPASKWQVLGQCKSPHLFGHWHESPRPS